MQHLNYQFDGLQVLHLIATVHFVNPKKGIQSSHHPGQLEHMSNHYKPDGSDKAYA